MNRYDQVYSTEFGWSRAHPIKNKEDAHETLYLLFKRDGVPTKMVIDGSTDQTLGYFRNKYQYVDFNIKQTKTYSPWKLKG